MTIRDWPLLNLALEWVILHPEQYDQTQYRIEGVGPCGTQRCIAGWIAFFAGWNDVPKTGLYVVNESGVKSTIERAALNALGVESANVTRDRVAVTLFSEELTFADVLDAVHRFALEDEVIPTPLIIETMYDHNVISERTWK